VSGFVGYLRLDEVGTVFLAMIISFVIDEQKDQKPKRNKSNPKRKTSWIEMPFRKI
jgi:hypothetical protein